MPDYDLGTAHGRIKIDVDDRGAAGAQQNLSKLEQNFKSLDRHMAAMQRSLTNLERDLNVIANDFRKAQAEMDSFADSTDRLDDNLRSTSQAARLFSGDIRTVVATVRTLKGVFDVVNPKLQMFRKFYGGFRSHNNAIAGVAAGLKNIGIASMGLHMATARILGFKKAMADIPNWQRNILRVAGAIGTLGAMSLVIPKVAMGLGKVGSVIGGFVRHTTVFTKLTGALSRFGAVAGVITAPFMKFSTMLGTMTKNVVSFTGRFGQSMQSIAGSAGKAILGLNVMKSGLNDFIGLFDRLGWAGKIAFGMLGSAMVVGPALMAAFGKSLIWVSNLAAGLWNGIKQLSGGFLALPGAISMVLASVTTLGVAFVGLKDKFKDIFSDDPAKAAEAMAKLPPHLKALGQALVDLKPKMVAMQVAAQTTLFNGMDKQIKALAQNWLPILNRSVSEVTNSFKNAKDQVYEFLQTNSTREDFSRLYSNTAQAINNISAAIKPALTGLKDISIVGSQFINEMTARMPGLVQKFADWAAANRANGNMMKWMRESWTGVKDLTKGMVDLIKATYKILTLFATNNGDNFLARFAASMKKFNEAVADSAASGTLKKISDSVKNLGTEHLKTFAKNMSYVTDAFKTAWPSIQKFVQSMSSINDVVHIASLVIQGFFKFLQATHLDAVIAQLMTLVVQFKAFVFILKPIGSLLKIIVGGFMMLKNVNTVINSTITLMSMFGTVSQATAGKLNLLWSTVKGLGIALAALTIAWTMYRSTQDKIAAGNEAVSNSAKVAKDNIEALREAYILDRGIAGKNVFETTTNNVANALAALQQQADAAPGIMDHIVASLTPKGPDSSKIGIFPTENPFAQSNAFNDNQATSDKAKLAVQGFKELGATTNELNAAINGSQASFDVINNKLQQMGDSGKAAAEALRQWRESAQQAAADAAALGEGGTKVVEGLKAIANAAGDADQKLNGLKLVLEGLGILQTNSLQAAADYAESIDNLSSSIQSTLDPTRGFNDLLTEQGKLNVNVSDNARNLLNVLVPIGEQFMRTVAAGGDAAQAYDQFAQKAQLVADEMNAMSPGLGMTKDKILELAKAVGLVKPGTFTKELDQFFNGPNKQILIKAGLDPSTINKIQDQLNGIQMPKMLPFGGGPGDGPHGGYADRAKQAEKEQADSQNKSLKQWQDYVAGIESEAEKAAAAASESGSKFVDAFAAGIDNNPAAKVAAERMAEEVLKRFHRSPPKAGPLAKHGDAAKYGGGMFVTSYSAGMVGKLPAAASAAAKVAGAAAYGMETTSMGFGEKAGSNAGKFLGQLFDLTGVASQVTAIAERVADTMFKLTKFISDPMSRGDFFGKPLGFKKTVPDSVLQKKLDDQNQQNLFDVAGSARRDYSNFDPRTGKMKPPRVIGNLPLDAGPADIQAKIIYEGQRRGLSEKQIQTALAIAKIESSYGQNIYGGQQGPTKADEVWGVYQQKESWGTLDQRKDPNYNINAFMDAYQQKLAGGMDPLIAGVLTQNPQLGTGALGSTYYDTVNKALPDAIKDYQNSIKSPPSISPGDMGMQFQGTPNIATDGARQNYDPAWMIANGFAPLYTRDANGNANIPQWATDLAKPFNLTANTYFDPNGGLHGMGQGGWAFDFNSPTGNVADMERFAQFLEQNMAGNLAQLIFSGSREYGIAGGENVGGPKGQGKYYGYGDQGYPGHADHVHGAFFLPPGVLPDTATLPGSQVPSFLQPYTGGDTKGTVIQKNPQTGAWEVVDPHGKNNGAQPGDTYIDQYGKTQTYTDQQIAELRAQMPEQFTLPEGMSMDQFQQLSTDPRYFYGQQADILQGLASNDALLTQTLAAKGNNFQGLSDSQITSMLSNLDTRIAEQTALDTPISRARASELQSLQSSIMESTGYSRETNPIDAAASIFGNAAGVASSIIGSITSGLESVAAADDIAKTLVRGVSGTKDINRIVDDSQKFIEFVANIAGSVSSVAGMVGSIVSAASASDPSGGAAAAATAIQGVSSIASLIQAGWETVNAVIDLSQEVIKIAGSYMGDFLGYLVGGSGGPLAGNVKFLLDQQTNQLLTYSAENPLDKRTFDMAFKTQDLSSRQQTIGNINVYGGPGTDPRDLTRQMMYQINTAQYTGALAQ